MTDRSGAGPGVAETRRPAVAAFDTLAERYDQIVQNEIFAWMRGQVHERLLYHFPPGSRVLEIGCGVGLDTAFLTSRGIGVVASDPAPAMVRHTEARLRALAADTPVSVLRCGMEDLDRRLDAEQPGAAPFTGIFSNFGALNCVEHLDGLGRLARRLERGGRLVLCLMSPVCLWEIAYFLLTARPRKAMRRFKRGAASVMVSVGGIDVPTFYHRPAGVMVALGAGFTLRAVRALAVSVPPPYLERPWQRMPALLRHGLRGLDAALGVRFPFNRLGDHFVMEIAKQ